MGIKHIFIWIIALLLGVGIGGGSYWLGKVYHNFKANLQVQTDLQREIRQLRSQITRLEAKKQDLFQIKQLLKQVQNKLKPQGWNTYTLNEEAKITPEELRILLETVSKGRPYRANFWFMPQEFAFLVQPKTKNNKQNVNESNKKQEITYRFKLKGKFLTPQGF